MNAVRDVEAAQTKRLKEWRAGREALRATLLLGKREVRTALRTPAYLLPNLLIPIFFYFVMVGSLEEFAGRGGVANFQAFQLPVSILFAVQGGSAGLNMVADIESGYFDKLLLTPASRLAILIGAMMADFLRVMVQATVVLFIALAAGMEFATGIPGAVLLILLSSLWGLAYSAIGFSIALKTGNSQATQSMWALFMPLMFLSTTFAPKEALSGWLKTAASLNPMTYLLDGMRALSMTGWEMDRIAIAVLAVAILGSITLSLALMALKSRVS